MILSDQISQDTVLQTPVVDQTVKNTVKWLVEEYVIDDDARLLLEIQRQGYEVKILPHGYYVEGNFLTQGLAAGFYSYFPPNSCVIFHGSINTARKISKTTDWIPGVFFEEKEFYCSRYFARVEHGLLNHDYFMLPLYEAIKRYKDEGVMYIRPDNPYKSFPGHVSMFSYTLEEFMRKYGLFPDSIYDMVVLSSQKLIHHEIRFVLMGTEILSYSTYMRNGVIAYDDQVSLDALSTAAYHANSFVDLDLITLDLGFCDGYWKLIEIGSFSCSSLYEAKFAHIVDSVSRLAYTKWSEAQS